MLTTLFNVKKEMDFINVWLTKVAKLSFIKFYNSFETFKRTILAFFRRITFNIALEVLQKRPFTITTHFTN